MEDQDKETFPGVVLDIKDLNYNNMTELGHAFLFLLDNFT